MKAIPGPAGEIDPSIISLQQISRRLFAALICWILYWQCAGR